jgi:hypothetical protein
VLVDVLDVVVLVDVVDVVVLVDVVDVLVLVVDAVVDVVVVDVPPPPPEPPHVDSAALPSDSKPMNPMIARSRREAVTPTPSDLFEVPNRFVRTEHDARGCRASSAR